MHSLVNTNKKAGVITAHFYLLFDGIKLNKFNNYLGIIHQSVLLIATTENLCILSIATTENLCILSMIRSATTIAVYLLSVHHLLVTKIAIGKRNKKCEWCWGLFKRFRQALEVKNSSTIYDDNILLSNKKLTIDVGERIANINRTRGSLIEIPDHTV